MEVNLLRLTLEELGHAQPPTPIHANDTTAVRIMNSTIKRQRSPSINMRYFWLLYQEAQRILNVKYYPGAGNIGDYQTKLHNDVHHRRLCPFCVHTHSSPRFYSGQNAQVYVKGVLDGPVIPTQVGTHYRIFRS